jgi:hypothetical protein
MQRRNTRKLTCVVGVGDAGEIGIASSLCMLLPPCAAAGSDAGADECSVDSSSNPLGPAVVCALCCAPNKSMRCITMKYAPVCNRCRSAFSHVPTRNHINAAHATHRSRDCPESDTRRFRASRQERADRLQLQARLCVSARRVAVKPTRTARSHMCTCARTRTIPADTMCPTRRVMLPLWDYVSMSQMQQCTSCYRLPGNGANRSIDAPYRYHTNQ